MKRYFFTLIAVGCASVISLSAQVRETGAVIALVEGGNPQGYVTGANDQGVFFATSPGGQGNLIPYSKIKGEGLDKLIRLEDRVEALGAARALFAEAKYNEAATAFGQVARNYAIILAAPQNFAAEAVFYQMESLRRAGNYAGLAQLVNAPVAKVVESRLGERYQRTHKFQKIWALYGAKDMGALKTALEEFQKPVLGDEKLLPAPNFTELPPAELAQIAFLRGKVYESEGESQKALEDYYRSFTFASGNKKLLAKLAMGAAMKIQKDNLKEGDKKGESEMQSIAYLYAQRFGKDTMPADYQKYAERPPMAKMTAPEPEAEDAGGEEPEAPAPAEEEAKEE